MGRIGSWKIGCSGRGKSSRRSLRFMRAVWGSRNGARGRGNRGRLPRRPRELTLRTGNAGSQDESSPAADDSEKGKRFNTEGTEKIGEYRERQQQLRRAGSAEIVASWDAALRSRTAGSQDELRCSAIHKQRPYRPLPLRWR